MSKRTNDEIIAFRKKHFLPNAGLYHKKPLHPVKAQGAFIWDDEGKKYLDAIGGIVCISAGHNHPKIKQGMKELLERDMIQHTSTLYLNHQIMDAAEAILDEAPKGIDRVAFTNSGSEANELAFMAARQATGETMIVNLRHSYHGGTSGTLAACGHSSWRFRSQPVASVTSAMEPYCYRCPFGQKPDSCALECAKNVETTIQTSTHGKIAGFIAEPVMGVGGFIDPPKEYFDAVAKIVHNYGGKYISDEVQTGAGRCGGNFLLTKELGIDADIVTMAKGFGNGAAIGAAIMKSEVADTMAGKAYFNTFGGDPYQTMQAAMTVQVIREEKMVENAKAMGKLLKDGMKEMMKTHSLIGDVRGRGLLLGMELVKDHKTKTHAVEECLRFMDICKDKGLLLGKGGLMGNVVRIAPPLMINREDVAFMLKVMDESFRDLEKEMGARH
ncbi:MAG: aminotransferase class III-fold pyridoxal phosphate-dependent enzyme [Bdellovibrionales bacterium]|nr:aminotransferase class III-fold pyridoxal phosphate-dependent enzyme [Bdellovibrionales bacterium]